MPYALAVYRAGQDGDDGWVHLDDKSIGGQEPHEVLNTILAGLDLTEFGPPGTRLLLELRGDADDKIHAGRQLTVPREGEKAVPVDPERAGEMESIDKQLQQLMRMGAIQFYVPTIPLGLQWVVGIRGRMLKMTTDEAACFVVAASTMAEFLMPLTPVTVGLPLPLKTAPGRAPAPKLSPEWGGD